MCDQWGGHKTGGRRKRKRRFRNPVTHKTGGGGGQEEGKRRFRNPVIHKTGGQEEGKGDSLTLSRLELVIPTQLSL